ncbi:MAG: hypothetical protein H6659_04885 [Ardenticatenaceae bacterium]|nr:hypothetical protein [Ardenticatenaceae bacterium]
MKRLKEFFDLLVSFSKAWPIILTVLLVILAAITEFSKFANQSFVLSLPLWALILIVALATYPLGKSIQFVVSRRKTPLKRLNGLLWRTRLIGIPIAICPRNGCGCEVICKEIPPPSLQYVARIEDLRKASFQYSYQYECPVHGALEGIPNEPLSLLQQKAKLAFKA